jgi:hypothetical protein
VTRRVWLRAAALGLVLVGVIAGLTVYFSTESVPPCGVSGVPTWHPPKDGRTHHYAVVFPDRAACFFAIDDKHRLVGQLRLHDARDISTVAPNGHEVALRTENGPYTLDLGTGKLAKGGLAPFDDGKLTAVDPDRQVMFVTQPGLLGFRVIDMRTGATLSVVHFRALRGIPVSARTRRVTASSCGRTGRSCGCSDAPESRAARLRRQRGAAPPRDIRPRAGR